MPHKILVIEDDIQFREMLGQMLSTAGFEVVMAANGIEGLDQFRNAAPDLILTDILMPDKDGIETIIAIRHEQENARIIAMSGGRRAITPQFNLGSASLVGVRQTLTKPFSRQQLMDAIQEALTAE